MQDMFSLHEGNNELAWKQPAIQLRRTQDHPILFLFIMVPVLAVVWLVHVEMPALVLGVWIDARGRGGSNSHVPTNECLIGIFWLGDSLRTPAQGEWGGL